MTDIGEISETQAREVAEQAREAQWRQPSFGKELFLGRLRLDLVHPHPSGLPEAAERGEAFLARLREFCESQIDAATIERDAQIPDKVILGLKELGALGMKIETEYGGLGLSQVYYNKALALVCSVHPALGARLIAAEAEERSRAEEDPLSDREREVLRLLALGHTNQEIAEALFLSVRTVETHRAHIMQKLRISTRAELVRYALSEGLLEDPAAS